LFRSWGLAPLPREGGFFTPTWTSPRKGADGRACASAILFLMTRDDFSALHRLGMDEVWQFSAGDPAELVRIDPRTGSCRACLLGPDPGGRPRRPGRRPGGRMAGGADRAAGAGRARGWALFSCTVSPAWDEREFELGSRDALVREFPAHAAIVRALTR
jgi:uncharacterized protein